MNNCPSCLFHLVEIHCVVSIYSFLVVLSKENHGRLSTGNGFPTITYYVYAIPVVLIGATIMYVNDTKARPFIFFFEFQSRFVMQISLVLCHAF